MHFTIVHPTLWHVESCWADLQVVSTPSIAEQCKEIANQATAVWWKLEGPKLWLIRRQATHTRYHPQLAAHFRARPNAFEGPFFPDILQRSIYMISTRSKKWSKMYVKNSFEHIHSFSEQLQDILELRITRKSKRAISSPNRWKPTQQQCNFRCRKVVWGFLFHHPLVGLGPHPTSKLLNSNVVESRNLQTKWHAARAACFWVPLWWKSIARNIPHYPGGWTAVCRVV